MVALVCKATIGCVAAFDTYLSIKYAESLDVYEQNPLGRWLMGLDQGPICENATNRSLHHGQVSRNAAGTDCIQGLAFWRVRVAGLVALPLAVGQLYWWPICYRVMASAWRLPYQCPHSTIHSCALRARRE